MGLIPLLSLLEDMRAADELDPSVIYLLSPGIFWPSKLDTAFWVPAGVFWIPIFEGRLGVLIVNGFTIIGSYPIPPFPPLVEDAF